MNVHYATVWFRSGLRGSARTLIVMLTLLTVHSALADAAIETKPDGFDGTLMGNVLGSALAFMAPRILDPVSVPELTSWGLGGITALDPALTASVEPGRLRLTMQTGAAQPDLVWQGASPADADPYEWGRAAASLCAAAWNASSLVRGSGQQAMVQGMFDELFNHLDPYSRYVAPAPADTDRDRRQGSGGIGAALVDGRHGPVFAAPVPNGPAMEAGIVEGTRLLSVDGADIAGDTPEEANARLAGDVGTDVHLRVRTPRGAVRAMTITRAFVAPETVSGTSIGRLLVVKVTGFARDTAEAMSGLLDEGMRRYRPSGIVIDLRGNRGGLLQQAVTAAALVLDSGVAVTTQGRYPQANHIWSVQGGDLTHGLPLVVLVDGRTASAAEILAAALADHGRAVIAGSSTLGKGLVQTILQLPDGGELFVTWSRVLAPLGWPIQGLGVLPQLCTSQGSAQVASQIRALDAGASDLGRPLAAERNARPPLPVARILEIRAACPAAIGTDEDIEAAKSLLDDPVAFQAAIDSLPRME